MRRLYPRPLVILALLLLVVVPAGVKAQSVGPVCSTTVGISATGTTLLANPGTTGHVYVCTFVIGESAASTLTLIEGTGATCGTGTVTLATFVFAAASAPIPMGSGAIILNTATRGNSLCLTVSAGTASGYIQLTTGG
jgi:hypothetical protein